jgi:ATP-dependent Clp protease ATP-binding subunit ClpC
MGLLLAGAKERGELESRVTSLIDEIKQSGIQLHSSTFNFNIPVEKIILFTWIMFISGDIILLIDEVHTLVGSGSAGRGGAGAGLDIANLLKPPLARGELQVFLTYFFCLS